MTDMERFQNRLRMLSSINGIDLPGFSPEAGRNFNLDPYRYMRNADGPTASAIWAALMEREKKADKITSLILATEIGKNDSGESTVRGYLLKLLEKIWIEGESFDGKRPFGNSGWEEDIINPLVKAGLIKGTLDEEGRVDNYDKKQADELIVEAIQALT